MLLQVRQLIGGIGMKQAADIQGEGTKESPWRLKTPGGKAEFMAFRDGTRPAGAGHPIRQD